MNLQTLGKIDKGWGFELVFANNDKYCGKLLVFERAGAKTSLVFHKEKAKSWFVNAGKFKVKFIDVATGGTCSRPGGFAQPAYRKPSGTHPPRGETRPAAPGAGEGFFYNP